MPSPIQNVPIGRVLNYDALHARLPSPLVPLLEEAYFRLRGRRHKAAKPLPDLTIDVTVPAADGLWGRRLSKVGGHEPGVCRFLADNMTDADVVYDVGAHYGFYSTLISAVAPGAEVHGFEPAGFQMRYWLYNRRNSGARKPWIGVGKYVGAQDDASTVSLDRYAKRQGRPPTLVKCDIEGHEVNMLAGASELIAAEKTAFLVEIHPAYIRDLGSTYDQLLEAFPEEWTFKLLEDIRSGGPARWRDGAAFVDDGSQPYLYAAPQALAEGHSFRELVL